MAETIAYRASEEKEVSEETWQKGVRQRQTVQIPTQNSRSRPTDGSDLDLDHRDDSEVEANLVSELALSNQSLQRPRIRQAGGNPSQGNDHGQA